MMIVAALGAAGLLSPGPVDATGHSATRSFSATSVMMGDTVDVTIVVTDVGAFGGVVETLPDGFSYVSTTLESEPEINGQELTFALFGEESFTYTVRASDAVGTYTFSGVVKDNELDSNEVGGGADLMVTASELVASRSFSASTVGAGGELTVTIVADNYGQFGQVVETLPAGFGYVATSLEDPPWIRGQMLGFSLFGEESFTYTVTVSRTLGSHDFSGVVKDEERMEADVGGDSTVTVEAATVSHSATRSVDTRVAAGAEVVVTIEIAGLGGFGQLMETLPEGFEYVSSSLADDQVTSEDGVITFLVLGQDSFTYTVTASDMDGDHAFSGAVYNDAREPAAIGGNASVAVGSTTVTSDGGNVMLTVTPDAESTYFKGRIVEGCAGPEGAEVALCATVDAWDAMGGEIVDFALDAPSALTLTLTAEQVADLGGSETFAMLYGAGGVMVHANAGSDEFTALEAEIMVGEDGSATLATSITDFGDVAVTVDRTLLEKVVTSEDGSATLTVPFGASKGVHAIRILTDAEACQEAAPESPVEICLTIDAWDAQGAEIVGAEFAEMATLEISLSAERVADLGGPETFTQLHADGHVMVLMRDGVDAAWEELSVDFVYGEDGGAVGAVSLAGYGNVAVTIDPPLPPTGAMTPPGWLVLALALAGAAMIPAGILALRRTRA